MLVSKWHVYVKHLMLHEKSLNPAIGRKTHAVCTLGNFIAQVCYYKFLPV